MNLLRLLSVLVGIYALAVLSANDFNSRLQTEMEYISGPRLNFSYEAVHNLAARSVDVAFEKPDWNNPDNLIGDNGPMIRSNWGPPSCIAKARITAAFYQALLLAQAALWYIDTHPDTPGPSYQRYFAGQSVATVRNAFSVVFNQDFQVGGSVLGVANYKFLFMDLRYGSPIGTSYGQYDDMCLPGDSMVAGLIQGEHIAPGIVTDYRRALVILCPRLFDLADLPVGPVAPGKGDPRCVKFNQDRYTTLKLDTVASSLLHEFMHWDFLMGFQAEHVSDYDAASDSSNPEGDPRNGYGPYNAFRLSARNRDPIINADSYVEFAIECWWWYACSPTGTLQLIDPPSNSDTLVIGREDDDMNSP